MVKLDQNHGRQNKGLGPTPYYNTIYTSAWNDTSTDYLWGLAILNVNFGIQISQDPDVIFPSQTRLASNNL